MSSGSKVMRNRLVDGPLSMGARLRGQRWQWFMAEFPDISSMSVIDLGGTVQAWLRAPVKPKSVYVVNLAPEHADGSGSWVRTYQGDACDLPRSIRDESFDLVFSNSVLEHVGGHAQRMRFAESVRKLAALHWVQTPYRYFPVEPHWLFPGLQFMPLALRARVSYRWPLVHTNSKTLGEALEAAMAVELVSRTEMEYYFPDSDIRAERLFGLTKSLVAIKRP
jgi:hypothetical protein